MANPNEVALERIQNELTSFRMERHAGLSRRQRERIAYLEDRRDALIKQMEKERVK